MLIAFGTAGTGRAGEIRFARTVNEKKRTPITASHVIENQNSMLLLLIMQRTAQGQQMTPDPPKIFGNPATKYQGAPLFL